MCVVVACNFKSDNPVVNFMPVFDSDSLPTIGMLEECVLRFIKFGDGSFEDLILAVHAMQRVSCPQYDAYCASLGKIASWREIPAIPLAAFRQTAIRSFPAAETIRSFRTSGTTGEGHGEHHFRTLELYRTAALEGWLRAGLPTGNVFCLMASPEDSPYSSLSCMARWLAPWEQFFLGDWDRLAKAVSRVGNAVTLFGTALAFLDFFEWLGRREMRLPHGSLAIETGGYKGTNRSLPKAELYALFQEHLRLGSGDIWNEYGMTELSSQFYSRGLGNSHCGAPWVRALVIDPETGGEGADGETGLLRIFDLANVGSCCALQTRDLAIRRGEHFELIGRDPSALPRGCSRTVDEFLGQ